jgi:hypothetical protein
VLAFALEALLRGEPSAMVQSRGARLAFASAAVVFTLQFILWLPG